MPTEDRVNGRGSVCLFPLTPALSLEGRVREGGEGKSEVKLNHDRPYRPWISAARR